jgi:hypothetical protein
MSSTGDAPAIRTRLARGVRTTAAAARRVPFALFVSAVLLLVGVVTGALWHRCRTAGC